MEYDNSLNEEIVNGQTSLSGCEIFSTVHLNQFAEESSQKAGDRIDRLGIDGEDSTKLGLEFYTKTMRCNYLVASSPEKLSSLAVDLVREEFKVKPSDLLLVASIKSIPEMYELGRVENARQVELSNNLEEKDLQYEVQKRRIVNSLIQGSSNHAQNLFYLAEDKLSEVSPELFKVESEMMAMAELAYWKTPAHIQAASIGEFAGGLVSLDFSTRPVTIKAEAVSFALLLHELSKGVLEVLALNGLPTDKEKRDLVLSEADGFKYEPWDLRLGPALWSRFISVFKAGENEVRNSVFRELTSLPAKSFMEVVADLVDGNGEMLSKIKDSYQH